MVLLYSRARLGSVPVSDTNVSTPVRTSCSLAIVPLIVRAVLTLRGAIRWVQSEGGGGVFWAVVKSGVGWERGLGWVTVASDRVGGWSVAGRDGIVPILCLDLQLNRIENRH